MKFGVGWVLSNFIVWNKRQIVYLVVLLMNDHTYFQNIKYFNCLFYLKPGSLTQVSVFLPV